MPELTEREKELCRTAGAEGAMESLRSLGIDVDHPREVQQDMAMLNHLRKISDRGMVAFTLTVITMVTSGLLLLIWEAITKK